MKVQVEAAPYILTNGTAKNKLYRQVFLAHKLGNAIGEQPVKRHGFIETDDSFEKRLQTWQEAEDRVLFDGWVCKDMHHFQKLYNKNQRITVEIRPISYTIEYQGKTFDFPVVPDTIDDFINDCKRIGIKLFWKENIVNQFGLEAITSEEKVIDYLKIIQDIKNASTETGQQEI